MARYRFVAEQPNKDEPFIFYHTQRRRPFYWEYVAESGSHKREEAERRYRAIVRWNGKLCGTTILADTDDEIGGGT